MDSGLVHFRCPEPSLVFQALRSRSLTVAYPTTTVLQFSNVAGRTKRFPPTRLATFRHGTSSRVAVSECVGDTLDQSVLVGGFLASFDPSGGRLLTALSYAWPIVEDIRPAYVPRPSALRGVGSPPCGGDLERVDPMADTSASHLSTAHELLPKHDVTVASFLAPCLANLKVQDVDSFLREESSTACFIADYVQ